MHPLTAALLPDLAQAKHEQQAPESLPLQVAAHHAPDESGRGVSSRESKTSTARYLACVLHHEVGGLWGFEEYCESVALCGHGRRLEGIQNC